MVELEAALLEVTRSRLLKKVDAMASVTAEEPPDGRPANPPSAQGEGVGIQSAVTVRIGGAGRSGCPTGYRNAAKCLVLH